MTKLNKWLSVVAISLLSMGLVGLQNQAVAGTSCEKTTANPALIAKAGEQALALKKHLDSLNPQVALIARVGSDVKKYGMHFTHIAFVVKDYPGHKGQWTVVHLLNQCGTTSSSIYVQGLLNFFMDDLFEMDYQITVPKKALQKKLYETIASPLVLELHNKNYNMLAYPFSTQYQNSNQWILEVITAAESGTNSREKIQQILQETAYTPATIGVSGISKFGAQMFRANVKFDDHPESEVRAGSYSVVGVESVIKYLERSDLLKSNQTYQ